MKPIRVSFSSLLVVGLLGSAPGHTVRSAPRSVASLRATRADLTIPLDQPGALSVEALDTEGQVIPSVEFEVRVADTSIAQVLGDGSLFGVMPGQTSVSVSAGRATLQLQATVAGVAFYVDGRRRIAPGMVVKPKKMMLTNGQFRLTWYAEYLEGCEPAAFESDVLSGGQWVPASARCAGDWLYPGGPVKTRPTSVELVGIDSAGAQLVMRFGDHWIHPRALGFPSWYQDQPYPFSRTVWLRARENGYFTQITLERSTYFPYPDIEHEVGWGGVWGPARVRTSQVDFRTEEMSHTMKFNQDRRLDAAEFIRDGDPLYRVVVPFSQNPMISPKFTRTYGGVYVYSTGPTVSYGAYLYAAPTAAALQAREVCRFAWTHSPFPIPVVSNSELDRCGPR